MLRTARKIYLDYASLTPIDKGVLKCMKKYSGMEYMNPSSLYASGVASKKLVLESRTQIAKILNAHHDEIIFTASGTEANNLALRGVVWDVKRKNKNSAPHIIVSAIEHSSIIETARALEQRGVKVSYIPVDKNGVVDLAELKKAITPETVLVSVMMVNNELGTIEPIQEIAKIIRHARKEAKTEAEKNTHFPYPLFHTDACQAGLLPLNIEKLGVDLVTLDGHKIYGPRGIGMLYVKRGIELEPIVYGGGQEKALRSGTENIPGIAGFVHALELSEKMRDKEYQRLSELKKFFIDGLAKINSNIQVNADPFAASPHILNISIPDIDSEFFVLQLDAQGISCSTKSACLRDQDESYVLKSIGAASSNSIRFSFGRQTTEKDLAYTLKIIGKLLQKAL